MTCLLAGFLVAASHNVVANLPLAMDGQALPSLAPMLEGVLPSVVNISTEGKVTVRGSPFQSDPFFERFFNTLPDSQPRQRRTRSLGSGVIINSQLGYVVTNHHVIENADEIRVRLDDGRSFDAKVVGADPEADVAVIRIPPDNLKAIEIGNSDELRVGDFVVAIGNPFGLSQTATSGIVSALGRTGLGIEGYEDFIQTDASINQGNSGGALVNLRGQLVGVNTAILARGGGNVGIGFAIPANMALRLTSQIIEYGEVRRGRLGVIVQDLTPGLAEAFGIETRAGALISRVMPDSAAADAGLREGDVITLVDGRAVSGAAELRNLIGLARADDEIEVTYIRDRQEIRQRIRIRAVQAGTGQGVQISDKLAGALFEDVDEFTGREGQPGVRAVEVTEGSPAWQAGLRPSDLILSVNRQLVFSLDDLAQAVKHSARGLLLNLRRGDSAFYLVIP
ncbi:MAG: serine endoprotease DegQ [Proteobacteria bacterium]|nr:serine endoprotease DegQ [Pseudomonadota bacterium]MBP09029.1 serine endoprotease DegQ [Acidiferrobacteraceae bacterium]HCF73266.1 serine endoprotease DegQ [Gammaproteobacteria bacterium]